MKRMTWVENRSVEETVEDRTFTETYDTIVVGLGTAGSIAAIRAAQLGLSVLGLEQMTCMGGTGTVGYVSNYYFGARGGLFEALDEQASRLEREGHLLGRVNVEPKKLVLEQAALQAGVTIRYEAVLIGVYVQENRVVGVCWIGPDGVQEAGCRTLIDCTGDASAAAMAGCPTRFGRDSDGTTHAFSNVMLSIANGRLKTFYTDSGYVDHTDAADLTKQLIRSATLPTHLKDFYDEHSRLLKVAPLLGVREGRRIEGEETVAFQQLLDGQGTGEPLFYATANLDNHAKDFALESDLQQDWTVVSGLWSLNLHVPIPLGALIPRGLDNALVAGRSLSVDHDIASCVRMKRDMHKCGEIAAAAAFLALQQGTAVRDVSAKRLLALLEETGCAGTAERPESPWLTDEADIRAGLASDSPGIAIWSARRIGSAIADQLNAWCDQRDNDHLRKHSAFALALLGQRSAIPVLREIVVSRDEFMPKTSHMYSQLRFHAAIYLLGKLGDTGIVPELMRIIADRSVREPEESWIANKFIVSADDYRFQSVSYALMALLRIGDGDLASREEIARFLRSTVLNGDFHVQFCLNSTPEYKLPQQMGDRLQKLASKRLSLW